MDYDAHSCVAGWEQWVKHQMHPSESTQTMPCTSPPHSRLDTTDVAESMSVVVHDWPAGAEAGECRMHCSLPICARELDALDFRVFEQAKGAGEDVADELIGQ